MRDYAGSAPRTWTDETIARAREVLGRHRTLAAAAKELGVSASGLQSAFWSRRATLGGGAREFLFGGPLANCSELPKGSHETKPTVTERAPYAGAATVAEPGTVMGRVRRTIACVGEATPGRHRVAHVGDIHFGSKHTDCAALLDFLKLAADRGCTAFVQTGDVCDGVKEVLVQEQRAVGYDDQHTEAVEVIAKAPRLPWVVIGGNHDAYSNDAVGMDSGIALANRMREVGVDWRYLGSCLGRAVIHGARWELFHPHGAGSTPNSIRTTLNKKAEKYEPGDEPHVLAIGHFHKFARIHTDPENVFAIASGTFQRQKGSDFAKRMINPWDIGSSIVSWTVFPDGSVGEFSVEFIRIRSEAQGWAA